MEVMQAEAVLQGTDHHAVRELALHAEDVLRMEEIHFYLGGKHLPFALTTQTPIYSKKENSQATVGRKRNIKSDSSHDSPLTAETPATTVPS